MFLNNMEELGMKNNFKQVLGITPSSLDSISIHEKNKRLLKFMLLSASVVLLAIEPSIAAAVPALDTAGQATAGANGISKALNAIIGTITGTFGQSVAVLAVIVMGIMAMFGKLAWDHAIKVVLGIAIVFGAASILTWIQTGAAQ